MMGWKIFPIVVQDCVPFGAAALLTFDTVTLTPKQGKGIAVPYCFGCLFCLFLHQYHDHTQIDLDLV